MPSPVRNVCTIFEFDRAKKGSDRITRFGVYKVIRGLGIDLNLKARLHGIRHDAVNAAIKAAQENEIELPSVLKFSRHRSLTTLHVYVDAGANKSQQCFNNSTPKLRPHHDLEISD